MGYRLYLLSSTGKIRWQYDLTGPLQSDVAQLDIYGNGKLQMAFVADGKLQVLDILGRPVKNFPVNVPNAASMQLIGKGKTLRIAVISDDEIWVMNDEGTVTKKFSHNQNRAQIMQMRLFGWADQYFLSAIDANGNVLTSSLANQNEQTFQTQIPSPNSPLFVEKGSDVESSRLVYINQHGNIVRVLATTGVMVDSIAAAAPSSSRFMLADVDGDNNQNYVVLGNRNLKAWSRDKSAQTLWSHQGELSRKLHYSDFDGLKKFIAISDADTGELMIISATGNEITEGKYKGVDQALVTDLNKDNRLELVIILNNGAIRQYPLD